MTQKLLLVGGGHAEIPLILAAKALGYYVITTGNAKLGLGHRYADQYVCEDFSDNEAIYQLAKKEKISAICSGCNDFALLSTTYAAQKLGLPGHDSYAVAELIHHKDRYRSFAQKIGIPTPQAISCATEAELQKALLQLSFPLIIKPVDLTGGKGVKTVHTIQEAEKAFSDAQKRTKTKQILIEKFIDGSNHGFSAFLHQGKVVFYFADDEQYYLNKYMVSGAFTPTTADDVSLKKLCSYSEKMAKELSLVDGIFHIQYILPKNADPMIVEICRRPPGDLYIQFVQMATGVDYPRFLIMAETGADCSDIRLTPPHGFWLRHCIMASKKGTAHTVTFAREIQGNVVDKLLWYKPGEIIDDELYYKAGIVFLQFDSMAEMQEKTAKMTELIRVEIE